MLENIIHYLEMADPENVKLYFLKRKKHYKTGEISYTTYRAEITPAIGENLTSAGLKLLTKKIDSDPEYREYGVLPCSDRSMVEYIEKSEIPFLEQIFEEISRPDLDHIPEEYFDKVHGYIVKIESESNTIYLFKKYTPKKLLEKGKIVALFQNERFDRLEQQIIAFENDYDAVYMHSEEINPHPENNVYILKRRNFEWFFSFIEEYQKELEEHEEYVEEQELVADSQAFLDYCKQDQRKLKKVARILKSEKLEGIDPAGIGFLKDEYDLNIELNKEGQIVVTKESLWEILRIFDDDYLHSQITDYKYEARSKVRK